MADYENALVSKAIATAGLAEVVTRGVEPAHFYDSLISEVYDWSLDFMREHGGSPSMGAVKNEFPGWKPVVSKDPLSYHLEQFILHVREVKAIELLREYHDMLDDPDAIREIEVHALDMARELTEIVPAPRAARLSAGTERREEYYRRKREGIKHGIDLGIPTFDQITMGIQPHELVIWGGPPGGGKTTGLQHTAVNAYTAGKTILFISLEVEAEQIIRKFDVMLSRIRGRALKALDLEQEEERKWTEVLERCESERMQRDIIVRDDIRNCTVEKVAAEQMRYRPQMVCVDYLEEMRTPRGLAGWEGVAMNGRGLKQAARVSRVPHITATQLNREGETAYQSAQKIADLLLVLSPPEEDSEAFDRHELKLSMRKYRDGPSRKTVTMKWDVEHGDLHELNGAESRSFNRKPLGERPVQANGVSGSIAKAKSKRSIDNKGVIGSARQKRKAS